MTCVQCKLCNYAYIYMYIFILPWVFMLEIWCLVFFYRGSFLTTEPYPVVVVLRNYCTASTEGASPPL